MSRLVVCTGWNLAGWFEYGRQFFSTFNQFWPEGVKLCIYGEVDAMDATGQFAWDLYGRGQLRHEVTQTYLQAIDGCVEFLERNDNPVARGRTKRPEHHWKERAVIAGYNWRYDAWKFCRQGFIPWHAGMHHTQDGDFLVWLDGDVVTHRAVPSVETITGLLPPTKAIAYLGRDPKHPDIAFQLYRMELRTREFLAEFKLAYSTDAVFRLKEWHSAYVWKDCLDLPVFRAVAHNLTPGGSGHVWHQSALRQWGDHLKGDRKKNGRSAERR